MLAYYSLAAGAVEHAAAPLRVGKGLARHPVPVMLLARLAIDLTRQGRGLGKALVKDALLRTAAAADIAGIRALLVHAKDDEARGWYEALEFEPSPTDPYHLFLLMKDLRAMLSERSKVRRLFPMPRWMSACASFLDLRLDRSGTEARPLRKLGTMMPTEIPEGPGVCNSVLSRWNGSVIQGRRSFTSASVFCCLRGRPGRTGWSPRGKPAGVILAT